MVRLNGRQRITALEVLLSITIAYHTHVHIIEQKCGVLQLLLLYYQFQYDSFCILTFALLILFGIMCFVFYFFFCILHTIYSTSPVNIFIVGFFCFVWFGFCFKVFPFFLYFKNRLSFYFGRYDCLWLFHYIAQLYQ